MFHGPNTGECSHMETAQERSYSMEESLTNSNANETEDEEDSMNADEVSVEIVESRLLNDEESCVTNDDDAIRNVQLAEQRRNIRSEQGVSKKKQNAIQKMSRDWFGRSLLDSVHKKAGNNNICGLAKEKIEELVGDLTEPGCMSYTLPLDHPMPDKQDFRGLQKTIDGLVLRVEDLNENNILEQKVWEGAPRLFLTGPVFLNVNNIEEVNGIKILQEAHKWATDGRNRIYGNVKKLELFETENAHVSNWEKACIEQFQPLPAWKNEETHRIPVPIYKIENSGQDVLNLVQRAVDTTSMCVFDGIAEVFGMNTSKFEIEYLVELHREYDLTIRRQLPQPTSTNFYMYNAPNKIEMSSQWTTYDYDETVQLGEFYKYYKKLQEIGNEARLEIICDHKKSDEIFEKMIENARETNIPLDKEKKHLSNKNAIVIAFATNLDLDDARFEAQKEEIAKLPPQLRPDGQGTLLNYSDESLPGLNRCQVYIKPPGARTTAHMENQSLGSINLNLGPDDCIWYGVPLECSRKMEALIEKQGVKNMYVGYWPNETMVLEAGIKLQKFVQKPGHLVYVGTGTFHWVQSNGFATNISWNVAQPNYYQLAVASIMHDHNFLRKQKTIMPIEPICWKMAEENCHVEEKEMHVLIKTILLRSLAKSSFERDFAIKKNLLIVKVTAEAGLVRVERCTKCSVVLFNMVVMDNKKTRYCLHCYSKNQRSKFVAYQRHKLRHLAEIFDSYKLPTLTATDG